MNNPSKTKVEESPYSSYYSSSKDPYSSNYQRQFTDSKTSNIFDSKNDFPNQYNQYKSYPDHHERNELSKDEDLMKYFIEKAKEDMNILPTEYRNKIKRYNTIFVASSCVYPLYFLFNFLKDYPEINSFSRRNLIFSSGLYLGLVLILNSMSNRNYQLSYTHLRSQYSVDQLRNVIDQYHQINMQNLQSSLESNKDDH